jgi:hypothetical protein
MLLSLVVWCCWCNLNQGFPLTTTNYQRGPAHDVINDPPHELPVRPYPITRKSCPPSKGCEIINNPHKLSVRPNPFTRKSTPPPKGTFTSNVWGTQPPCPYRAGHLPTHGALRWDRSEAWLNAWTWSAHETTRDKNPLGLDYFPSFCYVLWAGHPSPPLFP